MPTKLFDGSFVFFHVSKDTANPWIPEKPSPPPLLPRAVGLVTLASASVKVIPSAPVLLLPDPMKMSKDAVTPTPGTAVGQKAEPAFQLVAGVSCRLGGDAEGLSSAVPFSCHPPDVGGGIATGAAAAVCELAKPVTKPPMTSDMVVVIATALSRRGRTGRR